MQLPNRPTTDTPQASKLVDAILLELHELTQIHDLAERGEDHRRNRMDAERGLADLAALLNDADGILPADWLDRVQYMASIIKDTVIRQSDHAA